ncbi:MAG: SGNH/GDSL hydrolase family protein [Marinobacter sp.]|nr:SGNH/GDSL hydrolase family protein [Marinobacter sp.]
MLHNLALIPLAPLLLWQGKQVRANTPRLPEAAGPRTAEPDHVQPDLSLLILGDSAAAGVGVEHQQAALSGRLVDALRPLRVRWQLVAQTGLGVSDYLAQTHRLPDGPVDVLVISLGVNDVTSRLPASTWIQQVDQLLTLLRGRYQPQQVLFTAVPPMHEFPALPQPLRWFLGARAKAFNRKLAALLATRPGVQFVDVAFEKAPGVMASDGFHPGENGYRIWANALADRILGDR